MSRSARNAVWLVSAMVAGGLVLFAVRAAGPRPAHSMEAPVEPPVTGEASTRSPVLVLADARSPDLNENGSTQRTNQPPPQPVFERIEVRARADQRLLSGISVHQGGSKLTNLLDGPSKEDGLLALVRPGRAPLIFWGDGWAPHKVRAGDRTPTTVLLDRADGELQVVVNHLHEGEVVERTLLQPRDFHATGAEPWSPRLTPTAPDRFESVDLPTGGYDVYVWLRRPSGSVHALTKSDLRLTAGEQKTLELDAREAVEDREPDS